MINFFNGHRFDFGCASGAMSFNGDGWWFEQPFRWLGLLRPQDFTVITKTLTFAARKGHYRWWAPWRCVRLLPNESAVNAVGLSNPGYEWWMEAAYGHICKRGYKVIVSIAPESVGEAHKMASDFNRLRGIVGLQLNVSCPNISRDGSINRTCELAQAVLSVTDHPLILKLSYVDDYLAICKALDGMCVAYELINSVPWDAIYPGVPSPLSGYGLMGGVSGKAIRYYACLAMNKVIDAGVRTPIISGGGIDTYEEVLERKAFGAKGFVFGSVFIRHPTRPNKIIERYRRDV